MTVVNLHFTGVFTPPDALHVNLHFGATGGGSVDGGILSMSAQKSAPIFDGRLNYSSSGERA
jgi:hypothetical protein